MSRKTLNIAPSVTRLLDATERQEAMTAFRQDNGNPALAKTIRRELAQPLEEWADSEFRQYGHHTGTDAALRLCQRAVDMAERWELAELVLPETLESLESEWQEFCDTFAFSGADLWEKQHIKKKVDSGRGGKHPKRMQWAEDVADHLARTRGGLAFNEVWESIPESNSAEEIELDAYDLAFFKDGDRLFVTDLNTTVELGDQSKSNFGKRYFRPAKNNLDTN